MKTVSPINSFSVDDLNQSIKLPDYGHRIIVCPLNGKVSVAGRKLDPTCYLYLDAQPNSHYSIDRLSAKPTKLLLCYISPGFISEIAKFLSIPEELGGLLESIALPKGDSLSSLLDALVMESDYHNAEELLLEIVGQQLQLQRARFMAIHSLSKNKQSTRAVLVGRLLRARQYIEAHCLKHIQTKDVASHVALSEYHFTRLFKAAFGITVHKYVMRLRLDAARHRLESKETNITNIAHDIGYTSLSAFVTAFRKAFGVSPSVYQSWIADSKN